MFQKNRFQALVDKPTKSGYFPGDKLVKMAAQLTLASLKRQGFKADMSRFDDKVAHAHIVRVWQAAGNLPFFRKKWVQVATIYWAYDAEQITLSSTAQTHLVQTVFTVTGPIYIDVAEICARNHFLPSIGTAQPTIRVLKS